MGWEVRRLGKDGMGEERGGGSREGRGMEGKERIKAQEGYRRVPDGYGRVEKGRKREMGVVLPAY